MLQSHMDDLKKEMASGNLKKQLITLESMQFLVKELRDKIANAAAAAEEKQTRLRRGLLD